MKWNFRTNFECWQEVCGLKLTFNLSGNSGLSHPVIGFSRANSVFIGILPDEYRMLSRKPDKRMWQTGFDNPDFFFLISSDILWFHSFINSSQKCRKRIRTFIFSFLLQELQYLVHDEYSILEKVCGLLVLIFLHQAKTLCAQNISGRCIADEICQLKFFWGG